MLHSAALLDSEESRNADRAAIRSGISGETLMENAGHAVTDMICETYGQRPTLVVCGTGNNGGDGFVVARLLRERGWHVIVALVGRENDMHDDAALAKNKWQALGGRFKPFHSDMLQEANLIVDAMVGTGLNRDIEGMAKETINALNKSGLPIVSIDIASGIDGSNGGIRGTAIKAAHTVSFIRPKLGHVLLPGKAHTGQLHIFDIGIRGDTLSPNHFFNTPELWGAQFPYPKPESNKYTRGHSVVLGGGLAMTGAAKLAALGALRAGSGLVSVACPPETLSVYASSLMAVMTKPISSQKAFNALMDDKRITAVCIGPGCGATETTRDQTMEILKQKKACVLDADALTAFSGNANSSKALFNAISSPVVMTPHEGEFARLFKAEGVKTERAQAAAKISKSAIVLKGNDTVIAAPDGRIAVNAEAPPWLATAGSGDVLAGIITGLLAQGMPAFEAACAGVWLHSRAAIEFGPGLTADDLPGAIPSAIKALYTGTK